MPRNLTFQDLEQMWESSTLTPQVNPDDSAFVKAMINTGMGTGVYNAIFGSQAWYMLNTESNIFGVLPKLTWDKSGFRTISAFTRTPADIGITETANLPTPTTPTINIVKITPKIQANPYMTTQVVEQLARISQDDIYGNLDMVRQFYATEHVKLVNQQIGALAVGDAVASSVSGAGIATFEALDRIVASYDEGSGIGLTGATSPTLAEVINPWNSAIDRSGGVSSYDAYVTNASGTFGTAGALTDDLIRTVLYKTKQNGAFSNLFLTGYDTYADIQGLYMSSWRTLNWGEMMLKSGINGIETPSGVDVGIPVSTVYGLPVIQAVDTPADAKSRLFLLDTTDTEGYGDARMGLQILQPTQNLETTAKDFILLGSLAYEGVYTTIGEIQSRFMGAQGKIRDLS